MNEGRINFFKKCRENLSPDEPQYMLKEVVSSCISSILESDYFVSF